jgi:putative DNA primase/helicase
MIFSCNEIPKVLEDDTDAYFRRWCVITFPVKFTKENADPDLGDKLAAKTELSGVFNRAVAGLARLLERKAFSNDDGIDAAREEYLRMSDPVAAFVMDEIENDATGRLEIALEGMILKHDLYILYTDYCRNRRYLPRTKDGFFKLLQPYVPNAQSVRKREGGKVVWMIQGLQLRPGAVAQNPPQTENVQETDPKLVDFGGNGQETSFVHEETVMDADCGN